MSGLIGFADGVASQARFAGILGIAVDAMGNIYVADSANHAIRRISPSGIVSTIVGSIGAPQSGDVDGLGSAARLNTPTGIAVTITSGGETVLYVADSGNHKVKRITLFSWADPTNPDNWVVNTVAGTGTAGKDDETGNLATFNELYGVAVDSWGNVYVTERTGNRVRRLQFKGGDPNLATNWQVSLVAGDNGAAAGASGDTDGTGSSARFNAPCGIAVDRAGNLYVADSGNHRIRKIVNALGGSGGTVSTLAGSTQGYADGTGTSAQFNTPKGVTVDTAGYLYIADTGNHRIRRVSPTGVVTTIAGTGTAGSVDGAGNVAQFNSPSALAIDASGNLYVADGANGEVVRLIQRIINAGSP
jgi:sugar lactone lactonase YvrE